MSVDATAGSSDATARAGVAVLIALIAAVGYLLVLFVSGIVGLVEQLATPAAHIDFNGSVIATIALPLFLFAYLTTPELVGRRRLKVALVGAFTGMVVCAAATAALAPSIDRPSSFEFAAAAYLLFAACGLLPALAIVRGFVFFDRDTQVASAGDHYVDTGTLEPQTAALIAKHAPALKAPRGWRPPALFGARDALTRNDLRRILSLEDEEARRLRDLHDILAANAQRARDDAHHAFVLTLSPEARALFEAALRADVEAVQGIAAVKAELAQEIARLTEENTGLRAAVTDRGALMQALAHSARTRTAQQHELDWLWSEWERHAPRPTPSDRRSTATPPTVVHLHTRRSSATPTPYGGRS